MGASSLHWLVTSGTFVPWDLWGLAFAAFLIGFMIRLPFIISNKVKSARFAYDNKRFFEKFEGLPAMRSCAPTCVKAVTSFAVSGSPVLVLPP